MAIVAAKTIFGHSFTGTEISKISWRVTPSTGNEKVFAYFTSIFRMSQYDRSQDRRRSRPGIQLTSDDF